MMQPWRGLFIFSTRFDQLVTRVIVGGDVGLVVVIVDQKANIRRDIDRPRHGKSNRVPVESAIPRSPSLLGGLSPTVGKRRSRGFTQITQIEQV